jgi:hypothetical protein
MSSRANILVDGLIGRRMEPFPATKPVPSLFSPKATLLSHARFRNAPRVSHLVQPHVHPLSRRSFSASGQRWRDMIVAENVFFGQSRDDGRFGSLFASCFIRSLAFGRCAPRGTSRIPTKAVKAPITATKAAIAAPENQY